MIVAFVQFPMGDVSPHEMKERYRSTASKYQKVVGLIRKYYLLSEDRKNAGGLYLFESRESAEKLYTPEWSEYIKNFYGAEPVVEYFECPLVVDNLSGEIRTAEVEGRVS
ncbi:MAG: YdhR family protein [Candidatus Binatia bacterium]